MDTTLKTLYERKSVRAYTDQLISREIKAAIIEAALQAPTAGNMTLYSILDITDPSLKEQLAISCDHQPFIAKAPLVLVFAADYQRWYDSFCLVEEQVRQPQVGDFMLACADTFIAAQNAVVAADLLGLGSCYIGDIIENYEIHQKLLNLPNYVAPVCMLCFGYPTEQQQHRPKPKRYAASSIVHENIYQRASAEALLKMQQEKEPTKDPKQAIKALLNRKWHSEFSLEMTRSMKQMLKTWR